MFPIQKEIKFDKNGCPLYKFVQDRKELRKSCCCINLCNYSDLVPLPAEFSSVTGLSSAYLVKIKIIVRIMMVIMMG